MDMFFTNSGIHRIFNNIGMQLLDRGIDIPDPHLGIGFAEMQAPIPYQVEEMQPTQKKIQLPEIKSYNDTFIKTKEATPADFGSAPWYGESIGGF